MFSKKNAFQSLKVHNLRNFSVLTVARVSFFCDFTLYLAFEARVLVRMFGRTNKEARNSESLAIEVAIHNDLVYIIVSFD